MPSLPRSGCPESPSRNTEFVLSRCLPPTACHLHRSPLRQFPPDDPPEIEWPLCPIVWPIDPRCPTALLPYLAHAVDRCRSRPVRQRDGERGHDSCEPPGSVGLPFHDPHHLAIENRDVVAFRTFARKISPLECPVSRDLDVLNLQVVTQSSFSPAACLPLLVICIDHRRANFRRTIRRKSNGVFVP